MYTVAISPELRKYLLVRGIDLDAPDEMPEPEDTFAPSLDDEADYVEWRAECEARERDIEDMHRESQWLDAMERAKVERECCAWVIRPV